MTSPLTQTPASSVLTVNTLPIIQESISQILLDAGCENVWSRPIPPITAWEDFTNYIKVQDGVDLDKHEAWFITRSGFRVDPVSFGTFTKYQKMHRVAVQGLMWDMSFDETHDKMQNQTEKNAWWVERNKGGLHSSIIEISEVNVDMSPQTLGDMYLYQSTMTLGILMEETETGGRQ